MLRAACVALRLALLTIVLLFCYAVGTAVVGLNRPIAPSQPAAGQASTAPSTPEPMQVLKPMLVFCAAVVVVMAYIILRARRGGWKLVLATFVAMYGVSTLISQIETVVYLRDRMPPGMIPRLFLLGAVVAALFSPTLVLLLGRLRATETSAPVPNPAAPTRWILAFAVIGIVYLVLYMGFGYFFAWKNPAVQAYYGGTDPGSFMLQMGSIWRSRPWMFFFQIGRGLAWAAFVLPLVRLMRRSPVETGIAVALFFGVWSLVLLLPNPVMPATVARAHLFETLWSDLIFGAVVGWLLARMSAPKAQPTPLARAAAT